MLITDRITRFQKDDTPPSRLQRMITLPDSRQITVTWMPYEFGVSENGHLPVAWADDDHPPVRTPDNGPGRWFDLIPDSVTAQVGEEAISHTAEEVSSVEELKPGCFVLEPVQSI